jgi:predicted dehydrogenase
MWSRIDVLLKNNPSGETELSSNGVTHLKRYTPIFAYSNRQFHSSAEEIRVGLIGCGGIGRLRATAVGRTESFRLVCVSDIDGPRARSIASKFGVAVEKDWQTLVARNDVDMVIVSTPPSLHSEMCIGALNAGKHVLCEKPLARTPEECMKIVEAAEKGSRLLATGFNYRFYPSIRKARALLDSGIIGDLDHIRSYTGYSARDHDHEWLHDLRVMGGGALRDNGIHLIDLTAYFLGEVSQVKGFSSNSVWGFEGCEDNGFILLRSAKGKIASFQASWSEWRGYRFLIEIYGTRGCIRAFCFPMLTQVIWSNERGGRTRRRTHYFPMSHIAEHLFSYQRIVIQSFIQEFQAFLRALRGEPTLLATGRDGLRAIEIAHAVSGGFGERISSLAG